jgi:hypothetical protein
MPKGISLHIGLNIVDPNQYGDDFAELEGCENDARDMQDLAAAQGFQSTLLLNNQATAAAVTGAIKSAAAGLVAGDYFLVTFSGHGSQVINELNGDEELDGLDETWVLFDRNLIDDELSFLWSLFWPDVRILVISDSCHSGTISRAFRRGRHSRAIRHRSQLDHLSRSQDMYDVIRRNLPNPRAITIGASVLSLSACRDDQEADDGPENGRYTKALLQVWNNGEFNGDFARFHGLISAEILGIQEPQIQLTGASAIPFIRQRPFSI